MYKNIEEMTVNRGSESSGETSMCPAAEMETVSGTFLYFPHQANGGLNTCVKIGPF